MRTLVYEMMNAKGNEFVTMNYAETLKKENYLLKTFLVERDLEDKKLKEKRRNHAKKVMDIFGIKRG